MSNQINQQARQDMFNFVLKSKSAVQKLTKEVLKEISVRLVMRSPLGAPETWKNKPKYWYAPGHFLANWQLQIDGVNTAELPGVDPSREAAVNRMVKSIPRWPMGHTYYFVNNAPYAMMLERGHSSQAPAGMVALTVLEFTQICRDAELRYINAGE